jgi:hypothetical protein
VCHGTILVIAFRIAEPMFTVSFIRPRCGAPRRSGYLNVDLLKEHKKEQMRQLDQAA